MRTLPEGLTTHLDSGATTLAWCWRLTRTDGVRLGFTDHDRDIAFDGTTFEAAAGFSASEIHDSVGLGVDNLEVEGAITSARLDGEDLAAGLYDNAAVEIFRVNWSSPDQRVLARSGNLGEIRRAGKLFTAEVRGLQHHLQVPRGRLFQHTCDADVGDQRCGVDLGTAAFQAVGTVGAVTDGRRLTVAGLGAFAADWFSGGVVTFTDGANAGRRFDVKSHVLADGAAVLELWEVPARPVQPGDALEVTAGCDKQLATCSAKFGNVPRFRGFPLMPGNAYVTRLAGRGR